jgi:glycosyltransferase involved in cell wall biosynthesis
MDKLEQPRVFIERSSRPKFSIIITTYNRENLLPYAIESLEKQTYRNFETIVINDHGKSVEKIIENFNLPIKFLRLEKNSGLSAARNAGLSLAKGEYITYLDDDDLILPQHLEVLSSEIERHPGTLIYTDADYVAETIESELRVEHSRSNPLQHGDFSVEQLLVCNFIPVNTFCHPLHIVDKIGYFDESLSALEDWDFLLRASTVAPFLHIKKTTVEVRTRLNAGDDHMLARNKKDFPSLYQRIYQRYPSDNQEVQEKREKLLESFAAQNFQINNTPGKEINLEESYSLQMQRRTFIAEDFVSINRIIEQDINLSSIHVIIRVDDGKQHKLADTLDSLGQQIYPHWHLDVISPLPSPDGWDGVPCIAWHTIEKSPDWKTTIDSLVAQRTFDWIVELPVGACLDSLYLWRLAEQAKKASDVSAIFVDDDCLDETGIHCNPRFKPGVNPFALLASDLAGPLCLRREVWSETGGASDRNGSPWFEKLLKVADVTGWNSIKHIPDVLISYSGAFPSDSKSCLLALNEHQANTKAEGEIVPVTGQSWSIRYPLQTTPKISIAIISRGQLDLLSRCLESIIVKTSYPNFEIIIAISNEQDDPEFDAWLVSAQQSYAAITKVIKCATGANHAIRCNAAIKATTNDFALLIREEAVIIQDKWLEELVRTCLQPDIAGVSPCMIAPGTAKIQEAGYVLGLKGPIGSPYQGKAKLGDNGYLDQLRIARDVSALSGACMLVRTAPYLTVGGMSEVDLGDNYADADLCLKLRSPTQRLIYQPFATVVYGGATTLDIEGDAEHTAQSTIAKEHAAKAFSQRWLPLAAVDPFWNTNLSLANLKPTPETDYRAQWQFLPSSTPRILACSFSKGESFFRIDSALTASRKAGLASECYWPQDKHEPSAAELIRLAPDTVIVQHYLKNKQLAALQDWSTSPGRPFIVYTIDDLITNMAESNSLRLNIPANARTRLKYALARCDRMVVSTDFLAESYRHLIKDIRVVPNRLEKEIWLPLQSHKRTSKKPRIGWAGGRTHQDDLQLLKEVIEQTRGEADWIFFGMCPDEIRPLLCEYHPYTTLAEYPSRLAALNLDIAVAPLAQIPFNQAKSNLRLLEYGILGIPVVCTDIDPYRGSPACCVDNTKKAWTTALRQRIHDTKAREREGSRMRQWVIQHYLQEDHLNDWLSAHLPD